MNHISNVKISFTIEKPMLWKEHINKNCVLNNLNLPVKKNNILVFKNKYTFCVFEKKNNLLHFNVTGVKHYDEIEKFNIFFKTIFPDSVISNLKIDNLTATFNIKQKINLLKLYHSSEKVKYNPERFPGLFLKDCGKTCIIFKNGKIVILGCKNKKEVCETWQKILKKILNVIII
jgi:hypothetical protein